MTNRRKRAHAHPPNGPLALFAESSPPQMTTMVSIGVAAVVGSVQGALANDSAVDSVTGGVSFSAVNIARDRCISPPASAYQNTE